MSKTGIIYGVNGPVIYLKGDPGFKISEMVYVGKDNLVGEVIGRIIDYAPQPNFAEKVGKPVENLLKNPNFEGEFDINPETKLIMSVGDSVITTLEP